MSTTLDNCNNYEIHAHHTSLVDRVWSRLTNASNNREITSDNSIKQKILRDQKLMEMQNQARRTADVHRMIMRSVL